METNRKEDLALISRALDEAVKVLSAFTSGAIQEEIKAGGSPVTEADRRVDGVVKQILLKDGEGWLSEETADDKVRLQKSRVWVVDPLDGTREFVDGLPEWCVSIGLVEDGRAVAGGIHNPATGQRVLGSLETGVTLNGQPAKVRPLTSLKGISVLASRTEVKKGQWDRFRGSAPFTFVAMGSVAYKMSLVAAGLADATWTLVPKNEWDVAAGAALVKAAGGVVHTLDGGEPTFNRPNTLYDGFIAVPRGIVAELGQFLNLPLPGSR